MRAHPRTASFLHAKSARVRLQQPARAAVRDHSGAHFHRRSQERRPTGGVHHGERTQPIPGRTRRTSSATRRDDLADWRRLTRPVILENFLNHTRDLRWSRELIDLLLDELHVSDEFDDLIGRVPPSAQVNYPQLVALALVLRHSWYPEDLARIIAEPGL